MKGNDVAEGEYTATIGLEIHAELSTKSKMFCGCANDPHHGEPNAHTCPVCMGHPGTLPVVNRDAVKKVLMVGAAVGARLADYTEFDRKNYFYPDIPKGYQISQYAYPLVQGGELDGVSLTRIHLEEDTARSSHEHAEGSLVDYNRAGVPLMELVTEPVIHDAETAGHFAKELQLLLRTLGVADANMEKGEMRVEANISVSKTTTFGTKVEVKNLNSFRAVEGAIAYEIKRHIETLQRGGVIEQETRGWDENRGITFTQRKKESSHDYRYFPDPDIPSFNTSSVTEVHRLSEILPETPSKIRIRLSNLGLPSKQIEVLLQNQTLLLYLESLTSQNPDNILTASNYLTSDIIGLATAGKITLNNPSRETALAFAELIELVVQKKITSRVAKDILPEVISSAVSPLSLVTERGLITEGGTDTLEPLILEILSENPSVVAEVKGGKTAAVQFLVGQGMKKSRGAVDPELLRQALISRIG